MAARTSLALSVDPERGLAWRSGTLVAESRPLGEAAAAFRPCHSGWIMLRGAEEVQEASIVLLDDM